MRRTWRRIPAATKRRPTISTASSCGSTSASASGLSSTGTSTAASGNGASMPTGRSSRMASRRSMTRGATRSRYVKFSMSVDQDGDRYGFIRAMKGPQDAINQHRSKAMHIMNTRQGWGRKGVFEDTERARRELARPDGWLLEPNGEQGKDWGVLTQDQDFLKQTQYFQDAKEEIENYGPSPAIVGTNVNQRSGRALAMMQQNGIAELGPFLGTIATGSLRHIGRSGTPAAHIGRASGISASRTTRKSPALSRSTNCRSGRPACRRSSTSWRARRGYHPGRRPGYHERHGRRERRSDGAGAGRDGPERRKGSQGADHRDKRAAEGGQDRLTKMMNQPRARRRFRRSRSSLRMAPRRSRTRGRAP